jgi:hypothetical protein
MAVPPLPKIKNVRDEAGERRSEDPRFVQLNHICNRALEDLQDDLYGYAARAAVAELAESWLQAISDDVAGAASDRVDFEKMAREDITLTKEELNRYIEIYYSQDHSTPNDAR